MGEDAVGGSIGKKGEAGMTLALFSWPHLSIHVGEAIQNMESLLLSFDSISPRQKLVLIYSLLSLSCWQHLSFFNLSNSLVFR